MSDKKENIKTEKENKDNTSVQPEPETLHTTDPQEHMKGPVSSVMQNIKEEGKKNDKVSQGEADRKREENM